MSRWLRYTRETINERPQGIYLKDITLLKKSRNMLSSFPWREKIPAGYDLMKQENNQRRPAISSWPFGIASLVLFLTTLLLWHLYVGDTWRVGFAVDLRFAVGIASFVCSIVSLLGRPRWVGFAALLVGVLALLIGVVIIWASGDTLARLTAGGKVPSEKHNKT